MTIAESFPLSRNATLDLSEAIAQLVQDFVAHDMEWAALAVEELMRTAEQFGTVDAVHLAAVAASIRERGR